MTTPATRRLLMPALGLLTLAACASPTAPTKAPTPTVSLPPTSGPEPAPVPSPSPTDPPPTPPPAPPTAPIVLHVDVDSAHWYPGASFTLPNHFDIILDGNRTAAIAMLDPLPFALYAGADDFIVKAPNDFEVDVQGHQFTFNGLQGQAVGTIK